MERARASEKLKVQNYRGRLSEMKNCICGRDIFYDDRGSSRLMAGPKCLMCKDKLPREIKATGIYHLSCPWYYFIECVKCGYQNNLSKLVGFWHGCLKECENTRTSSSTLKRKSS